MNKEKINLLKNYIKSGVSPLLIQNVSINSFFGLFKSNSFFIFLLTRLIYREAFSYFGCPIGRKRRKAVGGSAPVKTAAGRLRQRESM